MSKGAATVLGPVGIVEMALATNLSEGATLRACRRVQHSETGATFNENMTQDQWTEYGSFLRRTKAMWHFFHADWLRFGRGKFGTDVVEATLNQLQFDFSDMERSSAIALLPEGSRLPGLTTAHHYVLGVAVDHEVIGADGVDKWLKLALEHNLSPAELKESIAAGKIVRHEHESGSNRDGYLPIHGLGTMFERWRKTTSERVPLEKIPVEQKREILEEIRPIMEFGQKLVAEIG